MSSGEEAEHPDKEVVASAAHQHRDLGRLAGLGTTAFGVATDVLQPFPLQSSKWICIVVLGESQTCFMEYEYFSCGHADVASRS